MKKNYKVLYGSCQTMLDKLPDKSVQMCVTSPPYYNLRDYDNEAQIGRENSAKEYVSNLVSVLMSVHRILKDDGTLWVNIGDSYSGSGQGAVKGLRADSKRNKATGTSVRVAKDCKPKDLIGIPWMLAFALREAGYYLRQDIIWEKPNAMPSSVTDRCSTSHEYIFLLSKSRHYYFDNDAIKETSTDAIYRGQSRVNSMYLKPSIKAEARNRRSVWSINTLPYKGAHAAPYPEELVRLCILAGSKPNDIVLDPFLGSGTTIATALKCKRKGIGIELNKDYRPLIESRIAEAEEFCKHIGRSLFKDAKNSTL